MDEMPRANTEKVTIAANRDYSQIWSGHLEPLGYRERAPMHAMEAESLHEVREAAGASNTRYDYRLVRRQFQSGEAAKCRVENAEIAAAWTPRWLNLAFVIFRGRIRINDCLCHDWLTSSMAR